MLRAEAGKIIFLKGSNRKIYQSSLLILIHWSLLRSWRKVNLNCPSSIDIDGIHSKIVVPPQASILLEFNVSRLYNVSDTSCYIAIIEILRKMFNMGMRSISW